MIFMRAFYRFADSGILLRQDEFASPEIQEMITDRLVIPGIVKNGLVVPQNDSPLPDGAHVDIVIEPPEVTPQLRDELQQWDRLGDEAWATKPGR